MAWQESRRWERRLSDPDFLLLRVGIGVVPLARPVTLQVDANDPLVEYDPVCLAAAQELAARHDVLADQPICLPLHEAQVVSIVGSTDVPVGAGLVAPVSGETLVSAIPAERVRGVVRAMLAQLVWAHSPAEVAVLVCSQDRAAWEWLKWLPHSQSGHDRDGPLPVRLITDNALHALELLTGEFAVDASTGPGPPARLC